MKKILFVFNHPAPYKVRLFNELSKYYDLNVIFERNKNTDRNRKFYFENEYNFKTINIKGIKIGRENFSSTGIVDVIKNNKFDLIIMNGYSTLAEMHALKYLKKNNIPYVFYINGGIIKNNENIIKKAIKTYYISGAIAYFSPDEESNKYLLHYGAEKEKIFNYPYSTIYNDEIVETVLSNEEKEKIKKEKGINFTKVFVSSGQLIKRKNYVQLVHAWSELPKDYGLYIFGDGKEKKRILKTINKLGLKNVNIENFLKRNDMLKFFSLADAFIFPSNEDIYGHVVNEALSQGLPVISTMNVNASKKLIKNGINGRLINNVNAKELREAIEDVLNKNLSANCIKIAKENTLEKMVESHKKYFEVIQK